MAKPPPVRGLRIDPEITLQWRPTIGISARNVDKLGLDIRSFREPLKRSIQEVLAPSFRKNFDSEGRPSGWQPLADYTVKVRGATGPILNRSGLLKRTVQQLNIWTLDSTKAAIVGLPSKIWYGRIHQEGMVGRQRKGAAPDIPQRRFVMLQDEDYDGIQEVFEKWLAERIERAGFGRGR